ncbi:symmetrical bis(5'-nucleosyl)-tetraphosphatase [Pollutimonas harenae]|uniref:Bis(5'-nucleosyl)-tetraphosphatase, symmetrical n=1 Tax=Pollutimonas harenae TaxID=657015 RepID=A0A853GYG3_9BURK|nr:symmetrical bis(5'-nucleosyl)-tetraphosphatase [Pollutimonas harenae]NYT84095.1 symmetrical bis(5'-nucleosyl)-tetraphosphatase [Pollutimonas harenae]TEA73481.1 symmetrical bis(5'-nucleosyl)-tetraphosphatase [Pollutimonas harenae]
MTTTDSGGNIWMVGDLQGCCSPLQALLTHPDIADDPGTHFWFAGDLINRGPDSLGTLRRVMALGDRATTVLGNHDLHFLAIAAGIKKPGKSDTIHDILDAPDSQELITWLRHRPLAHYEQGHLLVHAGVLPAWSVEKTLMLAEEIESALQGPDWKNMLERMYGNEPTYWDDKLRGDERLRVIVNALTRMRMCTADGHMEFSHKEAPVASPHLMPWFDVPGRVAQQDTIVFGHWSTLGLMLRPDAICLDTGCIWGRELTAVRMSDHKVVQVACKQYQSPGRH